MRKAAESVTATTRTDHPPNPSTAPPSQAAEGRRWLARLALPVLLGSLVVLLFFGALLDPGVALTVRDVPMFHLPLRTVASTLAREGLPLWNPMINGGQPILSNPNYAAFYPPTWLALAAPPHYAIGLIVVLHAAWAAAGAWLLARRLGCRPIAAALAMIAFVGGGGFLTAASSLNLFCGLAWLPWVLSFGIAALRDGERRARARASVLAAAAMAGQLLAGEPLSVILSGLALLCVPLGVGSSEAVGWRRLALRLAPVLALAALLGAVQLLPTMRRLLDSPRWGDLPERQTMTWSARPSRVVEWVFPTLRGDPSRFDRGLFFGSDRHDLGSGYLRSIYAGQLVLVLAAAALLRLPIPLRGTWAALIVLGVALAAGRHNPLYAHVLVHLPPWSFVRYPEKFLLLSTSGLAFSAALGWEQLLAQRLRGDPRPTSLPFYLAILVLAAAGALLVLPFLAPDVALSWIRGGADLSADLLRYRLGFLGREATIAFLVALASLGILALHRARRPRTAILGVLVLVLVLADLHRVGRRWIVTADAADIFEEPAELATMPRPSDRLWTDQVLFQTAPPEEFDAVNASSIPLSFAPGRAHLLPYWANLWGIPYALNEDFDLMLTHWARHAVDVLHTRTDLIEEGWTALPMAYLGAWNACNVSRRRAPEVLREEFRSTGRRPDRVRLLDNPYCLPRYRFVPRAEIHRELEAATTRARESRFDVSGLEFVVVDAAGEPTVPPSTRRFAHDATLLALDEGGARIDLTYSASGDALLVAAITFDAGWRAEVDGARVPLHPTALGQIAIEVPAGRHGLSLRYGDPSVVVGGIVTLLATLGCLIHLVTSERAHRAARSRP